MTLTQFERCADAMGVRVGWDGEGMGMQAGRTLMLRRTACERGTLARAVHELAEWAAGSSGGSVAHGVAERVERHYRAVLAHLPEGLTVGPRRERSAASVVRCEAPERFEDG